MFAVIALVVVGMFGFVVYKGYMVPAPTEYTTSFDHAYITVTDALTDDPIMGTVKLTGEVIQSKALDADGVADFVGLPAGTYTVKIENSSYYTLSRTGQTFQEAAPKTTTSKSYSLTAFGTYVLDNGDEGFVSSSPRSFDNTTDERYVEFDLKVWDNVEDTMCIGTVLTIEIDELAGDNLDFENIAVTSGQSITTVTEGEKYTISLGDLGYNSKTSVTLKVGISNATVENATLPISISVDDTPTVDTDTGATKVTRDFTLKAT